MGLTEESGALSETARYRKKGTLLKEGLAAKPGGDAGAVENVV
jgi:hypothetical protein